MRVANRIETCSSVEVNGVYDQRIAFPFSDRVSKPRWNSFAVVSSVNWHYREPRILFEEKCKIGITLHDLHRFGSVDSAGHTERQTGTGVVAFRCVVIFPLHFSPGCEGKSGHSFLIGTVLGHVGNERLRPHYAEVHFTRWSSWRRSGGRLKHLEKYESEYRDRVHRSPRCVAGGGTSEYASAVRQFDRASITGFGSILGEIAVN